MEVNIISTEFPEIMKELKFNNPNLILKKFKAAGYLDCEANKNYRKRQITKSDKSVHVIVVRFP